MTWAKVSRCQAMGPEIYISTGNRFCNIAKGAPARESRTGTRLVSPARGHQEKPDLLICRNKFISVTISRCLAYFDLLS